MPPCLAILGASGFLGARVVERAVEARRFTRVVAVGRRGPRPPGPPDFELRWGWDARSTGAVEALLGEVRADAVILAAAQAEVSVCEADPRSASELNAQLPGRVARWTRRRGVRLVHVSTDLVFGADDPPPGGRTEEHPPAPVSVYGRTKAEGEGRVLEEDPDALVVRLPLLFGKSGERMRGASEPLLDQVRRGQRPWLFEDEWRTPLEVGVAARALVELATRTERGRLHVAGPRRWSRAELGLAVLQARGFSPEEARARVRLGSRRDFDPRGLRPEDASLNADRARALLETDLEDPARSLGLA